MPKPLSFGRFKDDVSNYVDEANSGRSALLFRRGSKERMELAKILEAKGAVLRRGEILTEAVRLAEMENRNLTENAASSFCQGTSHTDVYWAYYYFLQRTEPHLHALRNVDFATFGANIIYPRALGQYVSGDVFEDPEGIAGRIKRPNMLAVLALVGLGVFSTVAYYWSSETADVERFAPPFSEFGDAGIVLNIRSVGNLGGVERNFFAPGFFVSGSEEIEIVLESSNLEMGAYVGVYQLDAGRLSAQKVHQQVIGRTLSATDEQVDVIGPLRVEDLIIQSNHGFLLNFFECIDQFCLDPETVIPSKISVPIGLTEWIVRSPVPKDGSSVFLVPVEVL